MADSLTPAERACMRERYTADLPPVHDPAERTAALRRLGDASRGDVLRLLDALDVAEAEAELYRVQRASGQRDEARAWLRAEVSPLWYEKAGE